MIEDENKIAPPVKEELAEPDASLMFGRGVMSNAGTFADLLYSTDTVLAQKGRDYKVYREVLRDDQCKSCFQQRRDAVVAANWEVEPGSEDALDVKAADFIREQINSIAWDRITYQMLFGVWYGHAVGECMWAYDGAQIVLKDVKVRDRGRFAYDVDGNLFLRRPTGDELMPPRKFWVFNTGADHDDEPYGLGLAHFCYWPVFFKRNDIKFWLVFQEKFASPTVMGKATAGQFKDPVTRAEVLAQLRKFASDTAIIVPEGVEVTLLEAARGGATSYKELCDAMDAAISKIILSQTMTTDNGSSRSQSETHQGVRDLVVKSDADLITSTFTRQVVTWLTEWNFPGARVPTVSRDLEPEDDLNARAERDAKVYTLGYEPNEDYITEHYGEGWQKRAVENGMTPAEVAAQAAAEFAELGALASLKGARRMDQQELVEAAARFANRYKTVLGKRVQQLVNFADASNDYATFRTNLLGMMGEAAPTEMVDPVARSGMLARLLGRFRNQR